MKIKKLTIAKYVFEIILIIVLSFMYYLNKPIKTPKVIYIQNGSINKIIAQMRSKNHDLNKLDSIVLRLIGSPQKGWIDIVTTKNTKADFLYKLTRSKAALQNVTLIPGETSYIFLNQLAKILKLNRQALQIAFDRYSPLIEGTFVPDTYMVPLGISENDLIKLLLNVSHRRMVELSMKFFGLYNESKWFKYVTIASIIQKESASNEEMPIVSSVIYNRLKKRMKLQMDGTLNYGKYSHIKITPKRIKDDKSIYNTYLHIGIPSAPVCNVSFNAIRAAIFPSTSNYLYFMKNKNNTHDFTCNYSTHILNIKHVTK